MSHKKNYVLLVIFYLFIYTALKLILVYYQDLFMSNEVYDREYGIGDVLTINSYSKEEKKDTDYFESKSKNFSMKVKNYFNDFEAGDFDTNYEYYMLYDDNNQVEAAFMMGQFDTQLSSINSLDRNSLYYEFNYFPLYISTFLRNRFLKKYDINDDVDLIKYIRSRKKINCDFFTPITSIKENYFYNFIETVLPDLDKVTYIEGDLHGYMYEADSYKQACIIKDDKMYCLTFSKLDYFDDEKIKDILESLVIEK